MQTEPIVIKPISTAHYKFIQNMEDVSNLLEIHHWKGGGKPGRRFKLEALNKGAIVLLVACWEAYVEDLARERFERMVKICRNPNRLPGNVRALAGKNLKEKEIWKLAGEGWRDVMLQYLDQVLDAFHTPRSQNVDNLFAKLLGWEDVSSCWKWKGMSVESAKEKLDKLIRVRGKIAHRAKHTAPIHESKVRSNLKHIVMLVERTDSFDDKGLRGR